MKIIALLFVPMLITIGCKDSGDHNTRAVHSDSEITLLLTPATATYNIDQLGRGIIQFTAAIKNNSTRVITIAHPSTCFPENYQLGDVMEIDAGHGQSEILLNIIKPDNERIVLREGLGWFEPGNVSHLLIHPGNSERFHVGWFFPNARGKWDNDPLAWEVFRNKGRYQVSMLLRNNFPKAIIDHTPGIKPQLIDAWTGEMHSNEVIVEIK